MVFKECTFEGDIGGDGTRGEVREKNDQFEVDGGG